MEASIGEVLVSILVHFEIGEFESKGKSTHHKPVNLSELPLIEKASEWGITVRVVPGGMCRCHGHCDRDRKEIQLVSTDVKTFLHGLAHAAIERLSGTITHTKKQCQEIMAELAAAALHQIVTQKPDKGLANSYSFILLNSVALNVTPIEACIEVFAETEEIIESILA